MRFAAAASSPWQATSSQSWTWRPRPAGGLPASARRWLPRQGQPIALTVRFRDPEAKNTHGDNPRVSRVDVIVGEVHGASEDANVDRNPTTRVLARFVDKQWVRDGDTYTITTTLPKTERDFYVRIRGTNTQDAEPPMDIIGESPWSDLWFYSNPIFVEVKE